MSSIREISNIVADHFGLTMAQITGPTRPFSVSHPRQLIMYLASIKLGATSTVIGRALGGRDHTTVLYGIKAAEDRLKYQKHRADLAAILKRLGTPPPEIKGYFVRKVEYRFVMETLPKKRTCLAHNCEDEFVPEHNTQFMCTGINCLERRKNM